MFKTMMKTIVKQFAKLVLGYVGDTAVWAVKQVNDKTLNAEYRDEILTIVEHLGADLELITASMKDGKITEEEADNIKYMVDVDMDKIKELL